MRLLSVTLMAFLCSIIVNAASITFQVDMGNSTVSPNGVHLVGGFQNWTPGSTPLALVSGSIYAVTLDVPDGNYQYKFINGNAWGADESVPAACGTDNGFGGYNRTLIVAGTDAVLPAVCYGSCDPCAAAPVNIAVTFQVNMNEQTVSSNGVYIAGSFQAWNPGSTPMTDGDNDGIYTYTAQIQQGIGFQYKFINGNDWPQQESVPMSCGEGDGFGGYNRSFSLGSDPVVLNPVCFGQCYNCDMPVATVPVTFRVNMSEQTVSPDGVRVAGNFQGWNPATSLLTEGANGVWSGTFDVEEGTTLSYKFVNGDAWGEDEVVPTACATDLNRTAVIGTEATVLPLVCYASCTDCETIVEPTTVAVTFQVNMSNEVVSAEGVRVTGNFQDWNPATSLLTEGANGVWSGTFEVEEGTTLSYKFVNGDAWGEDEVVPTACATDLNRTAVIGTEATVLPLVCYASCTDCETIVEPTTVAVTFQVNMSNEMVSAEGVRVTGNFQGWNPATSLLTEGANGVWSGTFEVEEGTTLSYKFVNGDAWGEDEVVPTACATDLNRTAVIGTEATVLPLVCYASCTDCETIVEPTTVAVTFQVNMSNEVVSAEGVRVAGNFQGWNPATSLLTEGANGVWSGTFDVEEGTTLSYKFVNGDAWGEDEGVPAECATDNNRSAVIGTEATVLPLVCYASCTDCETIVEPTTVAVTFQVNMSEQTVSPDGVRVAGNFQGWNPATSLLTEGANGVWSGTFDVEEGTTVAYKFVNGDAWGEDESVPSTCAVGNNRTLMVGNEDVIVPIVCYASCTDCGVIVEPVPVNVTFRVNMSNETVSPNGVHIAGIFQGWNPSATPMVDMGNGIYEYTTLLNSNSNYEYKFINGNAWGSDESIASACNVNNNRLLMLGDEDLVLPLVCFGECVDCEDIVEPETVLVLFQVDLGNIAPSAQGVHVAGDFQNWNPNGTVMNSLGGSLYELSYPVPANSTIHFRFVNGSEWANAEIVPSACGVADDVAVNRTMEVGNENMVFGPVCFGECAACSGVVNEGTVEVTFQVDMSNTTVSPNGVHIAGNFQGWSPSTSEMTDLGNGIYSFTASIDTSTTALFKFINGNDWPQQETVPTDCGQNDGFGGFNRLFEVGTEDASYGPVCFAACAACQEVVPVLVTLRVDMSNQTVNAEGVYVAGDFNNWSATATAMSLYAPNQYEAVVVMNSGQTSSYKFLNGPSFDGEETVPADCGVPNGFGGFNRTVTAGTTSSTVPVVCFSECAACSGASNVSLTLRVNMSQQTPSPLGIHVAGSFNNFSPSATTMTASGNGVYTATVQVPVNTMVTYKYLNGNDWPAAEVVPFECGMDDGFGGFNRSITVNTEDVVLNVVCFGLCVDCPIFVEENTAQLSVYPVPAQEMMYISGQVPANSLVRIMDMFGRQVKTFVANGSSIQPISVADLANGSYILLMENGKTLPFMVAK